MLVHLIKYSTPTQYLLYRKQWYLANVLRRSLWLLFYIQILPQVEHGMSSMVIHDTSSSYGISINTRAFNLQVLGLQVLVPDYQVVEI